MANYETLKAAIQSVVKTNGNNEITGALLQQSLLAMINSLGVGYQYIGIATPDTKPGTPDQNVFYLASTAGPYSNFSGIIVGENEVAILKWNGSWEKETTGSAPIGFVNQLAEMINKLYNGDTLHLTSEDVTTGYYRTSSGTISTLSGFFYSNPISVRKGESFNANNVSGSSAQAAIAMLSWVKDDGTFVSTIIHPSGAGSYSYTFEEDGYVCISGYVGDLSKFTITKLAILERFEHDIESLSSDIEDINEKIGNNVNNVTSNDVTTGYYRVSSGPIAPLSGFFYSEPILVKKGDVVKANNVSKSSAQATIAMFSKVDINNRFIALILNPSSAGTYEYTATDDGYIGISGYVGDLSKFTITRNTALFDSVFSLEKQVDKLLNTESGYDPNSKLPSLTENPIEHVNFNCGLLSIFKKVGVIGDSLASGEMQGWDENGNLKYSDMYELSWGQQLAKMTGLDVFNFSNGGQYAKGWMNGNTERTWDASGQHNGASVNLRQCYFIGLAHNDKTQVENHTYAAGIGTVSDINDSDYTQNADSYVGWYARIIQAIKSVEPRAYIFCITPPNKTYDAYSAQIRAIVEHFAGNRVYLVDLRAYGVSNPGAWYAMGNHLSAAGYLYSAYVIANYVDWIIRKNGADFKYTSLVGTDIYDSNPTK